jgi:transposase-like protein
MFRESKISAYKVKKIIECFALDLTATQTALLLNHNRKTINRWYRLFREVIYQDRIVQKRRFVGVVECDESYFGASRIRGSQGKRKRGRGTHKQPVFGLFERGGKIYTEVVSDCSADSLRPIIQGKVSIHSVVHTDGWRGYDGLVDVGFEQHLRINKDKDGFVKGCCHINGIESFWSFVKRRLAKFNGVRKNFVLHLKECEWRWQQDPSTLKSLLLALLKNTRN